MTTKAQNILISTGLYIILNIFSVLCRTTGERLNLKALKYFKIKQENKGRVTFNVLVSTPRFI